MDWLIVLGVLVFLALIPLGFRVHYDESGLTVRLLIGPVQITVYPSEKKKKPEKKKKTEKQEDKTVTTQKTATQTTSRKGGKLTDFLPLLDVALDFLGDLRRKIRVNRLEMKLIMAGGDPASLAINYGKAWAALGNLVPQLERLFAIKKRDLQVECDFTGVWTTIYAHLDLTITFGRLLVLAIGYGIRILREFLKIQNKRKGGAV